jgi:hypothetical protein
MQEFGELEQLVTTLVVLRNLEELEACTLE